MCRYILLLLLAQDYEYHVCFVCVDTYVHNRKGLQKIREFTPPSNTFTFLNLVYFTFDGGIPSQRPPPSPPVSIENFAPQNIILDQGISIRSQPFPHSLPPGCHAIGILQYAKHPMFTVHVSEYNEILLQRDAMHIKMSILEIQ